jgi:hypothetical protein
MNFMYTPGEPTPGKLSYDKEEKSFNYEGEGTETQGVAALLVGGTLQIDVSIETKRLLFPWGYSPTESWGERDEEFHISEVKDGNIILKDADDLMSGMGYDTDLVNVKPIYFKKSGMLLFGEASGAEEWIKIADGTFVRLEGDKMKALLLSVES